VKPILARRDWWPIVLAPLLALLAWPLVGNPSTWLTLTVAGMAMGLIIFITASGLTLIFGLMDILNFGHGVFIALGAFMATTVFAAFSGWAASPFSFYVSGNASGCSCRTGL
jgi:branched-chain amino acid transport system permease protein